MQREGESTSAIELQTATEGKGANTTFSYHLWLLESHHEAHIWPLDWSQDGLQSRRHEVLVCGSSSRNRANLPGCWFRLPFCPPTFAPYCLKSRFVCSFHGSRLRLWRYLTGDPRRLAVARHTTTDRQWREAQVARPATKPVPRRTGSAELIRGSRGTRACGDR